ncbi:uncharacterized protein DEA37_0011752 [Paragonimus westermani]|uniref:Tetratricopeptide repeat protein 29 n=1 Tax=Paragonimus westermani TaxID=34504 RepID=A0A5J4NU52_9TREM|nr:uncharacterized protein DEA37_0011752 [Paragonimus westermani]
MQSQVEIGKLKRRSGFYWVNYWSQRIIHKKLSCFLSRPSALITSIRYMSLGKHLPHRLIAVYRDFFDKACTQRDYTNLSRVCEALAKLYQKLNNVEDSIQYLHKFASSCERHGQWVELGRACQMLGSAYDTVGDYTSALKWVKKAYSLPHMIQFLLQGLKTEAFDETTESSRIMIGVTRAHLMHKAYSTNMLKNQSSAVYKTIKWKARPKNEDELFPMCELQLPPITFNNRRPKRDVLVYAKHPSTGFLKR